MAGSRGSYDDISLGFSVSLLISHLLSSMWSEFPDTLSPCGGKMVTSDARLTSHPISNRKSPTV